MSERCTILPDPRFLELRPGLLERLQLVAVSVHAGNFDSLLDPLMRGVLVRGFVAATAHEGTLWILDASGEHLVPIFNNGPFASRFVGQLRQPVASGLIGMVMASEQPLVENEVSRTGRQNKTLDSLLGVRTSAQIAVPFHFLRACRGVISCVQLGGGTSEEKPPPGFGPAHLAEIQRSAALLTCLVEYRLLSNTVGWSSE